MHCFNLGAFWCPFWRYCSGAVLSCKTADVNLFAWHRYTMFYTNRTVYTSYLQFSIQVIQVANDIVFEIIRICTKYLLKSRIRSVRSLSLFKYFLELDSAINEYYISVAKKITNFSYIDNLFTTCSTVFGGCYLCFAQRQCWSQRGWKKSIL